MKINKSNADFSNIKNVKIAIVLSRYNDSLGNRLLETVLKTLKENNIPENNLKVYRVPGALEIPLAASLISEMNKKNTEKFDAIITLGLVIRGATYHFELVCNETYRKLMDLAVEKNLPIVFGVLTVNSIEQAEERVDEKKLNKGKEFAEAALEMIQFKNSL